MGGCGEIWGVVGGVGGLNVSWDCYFNLLVGEFTGTEVKCKKKGKILGVSYSICEYIRVRATCACA